ncbi:MAG: S9 family peptidase [Pseudolabrys sp.]|nr:S9 family peptidase [Pseudolabrys sp.]
MKNTTGQGAGNPLIIPLYTFTPKKLTGKAPLIVFVHGGVHGDFETSYAHIIRELMEQGYIVVAPEYRGSTGYGEDLYDEIDYGGLELDDVKAARDWAVENLSQVDSAKVGIIGWSHGGYQTLLNVFNWPDAYQVAYAGVPVSDLVQRMGYKSQGYRNTFKTFMGGKEAMDNPAEYKRRSPAYNAEKLRTPLLVHTNTNDEDVNVMEVEHLIAALKAAGKKFEYKIYTNAPGGHHFNRIDTSLAKQSRKEIYEFLARYLK